MEEVIDSARKANIHSFVAALPEGYNTRVGGKGTQGRRKLYKTDLHIFPFFNRGGGVNSVV